MERDVAISRENDLGRTERQRLKAATARERARVQRETNKLARDKLNAKVEDTTVRRDAVSPLKAAFQAARDPLQRIETDDSWYKLRLVELAEAASDQGDTPSVLKILEAIRVVGSVKLQGMNEDELAGKTPDDLRAIRVSLLGWLEFVDRRLREMEG